MAEENTNESSALDNIDFLFRHPQIILLSFLIIFNAFQAYSTTIPSVYNAKAVLLFEAAIGSKSKKDVINEKKDAAEKILTASNVEPILLEVLKDKTPAYRESAYKQLKGTLLNMKTGIRFGWEAKGTGDLLTINFAYGDPTDCYRTVKAITDIIINQSQQEFTREMEANTLFFNNQVKFYKEKLDAINTEMDSIKGDLFNRYTELSDPDKQLLAKLSGDKSILLKKEDQGMLGDGTEAPMLKNDLVELQEKRKRLQASLDDGTFITQNILEDITEEDLFLKEYKKTIADKEMEIDSLLARGYKEEHPMVKQLRQEVDRAKEIRQRRMERIKPGGPGSPGYDEAVERIKLQVKELDLKIALIVNNLKETIGAPDKVAGEGEQATIKEKISRLGMLESERAINEGYYLDMRKNLANAELKYRTDSENVGFSISVIQAPELPTAPDSSRAQGTVLRGFIIAVLLSLGLGYLAYRFKDAIHSDRELASLLSIPVIATIDNITTKRQIGRQNRRFQYAFAFTVAVMVISRIVITKHF